MRQERPLFLDPWGQLAEEILKPIKVKEQLERINKFHHFESGAFYTGLVGSGIFLAAGRPGLAVLSFTLSLASGTSWAETSNALMRFRTENSKYLQP